MKPAVSELLKCTDLVVIDKRRAIGCKEESLLVSGTNLMGCSIAKALKLVPAATRRSESSDEHIHFKSMKQRWIRHGDDKDGKEIRKTLVSELSYMLKQDHVCADLGKAIRKNGHYPLALSAEVVHDGKLPIDGDSLPKRSADHNHMNSAIGVRGASVYC